jgi:hypothetical protein
MSQVGAFTKRFSHDLKGREDRVSTGAASVSSHLHERITAPDLLFKSKSDTVFDPV